MVIALICVPMAAQASLIGTWCNDVGDPALYLEADSMGIGEHRVCDWADLPGVANSIDTQITCRQIYFDGETAVVIDETDYEFTAKLNGPDRMHARFDDGSELFSYDYTRCDW